MALEMGMNLVCSVLMCIRDSNLGILKSKKSGVKAYQGNALNLSRFEADQFDMVLVFGPMYHLYTKEDKVKALKEAKRVVKPGGIILVAYCMNAVSYTHLSV